MTLTVSPAVKIFALLGALAALALGAGMMLLGGGAEASEPTSAVIPRKQSSVLPAPALAKKVATKAKASAAAKAKPAAKPKAKAKAAAKAPATAVSRGIASNGLPIQIMAALRSHNVVVVSLWGTGGKIDEMSRDEAAAGAAVVGAGFVSLNVIERSREAEALTLKLGVVLRAPGVLLFTSGGVLANSLDGFLDRETVAQAAMNALR